MAKFDQAFSHGDVMRRLHELERRVQELTAGRRLEDATVGAGGVNVRNAGAIRWFDRDGAERFNVSTGPSEIAGGASMTNISYFGVGGASATFGEIESTDEQGEQVIRDGILLELDDGTDVFVANERDVVLSYSTARRRVLIGSEISDDRLQLWDADNNPRTFVGPVTFNDSPDGFGIFISQAGGEQMFFVSQSLMAWSDHGSRTWTFDATGQDSIIAGGQSDDGGGFWDMLKFLGGGGTLEVQVRDGADSTYIPIAASDFIERPSSRATKDVVAEDAGAALDQVRAVPIRRWRHKTTPASNTGKRAAPQRDRVGPMAEDLPEGLANWVDPDGGVNFTDALWTLWRAVQELSDRVDVLES